MIDRRQFLAGLSATLAKPLIPIGWEKEELPEQTMKLHTGSLVKVADSLGRGMSHFPGKGCLAVVTGNYVDKCLRGYGEFDEETSYSLHLVSGEHKGEEFSWYSRYQLTLIEEYGFRFLPEGHSLRVEEERRVKVRKHG